MIGNKKKLLMPFATLAAILLVSVQWQHTIKAQSIGGGTFYTVSGSVLANGVPVADASVVLLNGSNIFSSTMTDASGNYALVAIGGGNYTASVYKNGYNFDPSFQVLGTVKSDQIVNFTNGTLLCTPAPAMHAAIGLCEDPIPTPRSQIVNGIIAFERFGTTFGINPDGTNQAQIPPAGAFPSWSADGLRVIYNRTTSLDPDNEIYITNADGTGSRQITFNFVQDYKAQFSPDGTRAVFYRLFDTSNIDIFTINTDSPNGGINEIRLTDDDCLNRDPTYSPDGKLIAFAKFCENPAATGIYTMNSVDGSNAFQLTSGGVDGFPAWRPDGNRIVFTRDGDIWAVNPSGTGVAQITFDPLIPYYSPVYSPVGDLIAFSRSPSEIEFQEIYTLNPASTEQLRITTDTVPSNNEYPSWQKVIDVVDVTLIGGVVLTFSQVTVPGNTVATVISPLSAGPLPDGFRHLARPIAFDLRTSAEFTGDIEVCFDVPNINDPKLFDTLVVFHNEGGALVDRTSSRDFENRKVCATVTSLSPFVVAAPFAPTSASVTISGRVVRPDGFGLSNASVALTDSMGNVLTARTGSFGYFSLREVSAGQTYIFITRHKGYTFAPQTISVFDEISGLEIIADPPPEGAPLE